MVSIKIKKLCKRLGIRLTVKKGSKRVYKSEKLLIKQIRKRSRRRKFGEKRKFVEEEPPKKSFFKRHKKKLLIAGGVAAALATIAGGHYYATKTVGGREKFKGYNAKLGKDGTMLPKFIKKTNTPKTAEKHLEEAMSEQDIINEQRKLEDKELLDQITAAKSKDNNTSEVLALEQKKFSLRRNRIEEDQAARNQEAALKKQKKEEEGEKITSTKNLQGLLIAGMLPPEQRGQILSNDPMTNILQNMIIDTGLPVIKGKVKEFMENTDDIDELQAQLDNPETPPDKKEKIQKKIIRLKEEQAEQKEEIQELASFSEQVKEINEKLANTEDQDEIDKLNIKLILLNQKNIKEQIKNLEDENKEENGKKIQDLEESYKKFEEMHSKIKKKHEEIQENGEIGEIVPEETQENGETAFGKRRKKRRSKSKRSTKGIYKNLLKDLKRIKKC